MAETQDATLGYGGELWLHNGTSLVELVQVKSFGIAGTGAREQVETTHLKSAGWRREYASSFYEDSEFEAGLNTRLLSDTDTLLADALSDGDIRAFKQVIPENGVPVAQIEGTCKCIAYERGEVTAEDVIEGTATFRVVTVDAVEAYVAP